MSPSIWQILIVLAIVLLLFGPSRIPGLGKSLGEAIRGFKKGISDDEIDVTESSKEKEQIPDNEQDTASKKKENEKESEKT